MNDNSGLCLGLYSATLVASFFVGMVCLELGKMSGGKLKFLEEANEKLATRLESMFPFREEWLIAARMTELLLWIASVVFLVCWCKAREISGDSALRIFSVPFGICLLGYCGKEVGSSCLGVGGAARLILLMVPVLKAASWIFFPVTLPLGSLARHISEARTKNVEEGMQPSVEDEILSLVEGEKAAGVAEVAANLEEDEKRLIVGAFELDEINVRRIMTPRVEVVGVEYEKDLALKDFVEAASKVIVESGHSRIPVYEGTIDNVIGIVYSKDLLDPVKTSSFEVLVHHKPLFIPLSKNIGDLLGEFRQNKIHLAIVVDEYGGTAGVVTFEDVLETLLGDIKDEYDTKEGSFELRETSQGVYVCDARMPIQDVNRALDLEIPEDEEYDTIAGYVSYETGRIPASGEKLTLSCLMVTVLKADSRRMIELEITPRREIVVE